VEGSRDGLIEDLDEKLGAAAPLDIINGPLMKGMDEVGRLFNDTSSSWPRSYSPPRP